MKFVALLIAATLLVAGVNARMEFAEAEYGDEQTHQHGNLVRPTVEEVHREAMPVPSVPEPLVAEEPKKSLVEEVTGINDADEMRFEEVQTQTKDAAASAGFSSVSDGDDDKSAKLKEALEAVKSEIVHKAKSIKSEKNWVKQVTTIIENYVHKTRRVNANVRKLQREVRDLFKKKKQIDNLILQQRLLKKLSVANKDLLTIGSALGNVKKKEEAFSKSKDNIAGTIGAIEAELKKLRGESAAQAKAEAKADVEQKKEEVKAVEKKAMGKV